MKDINLYLVEIDIDDESHFEFYYGDDEHEVLGDARDDFPKGKVLNIFKQVWCEHDED